MWILFLILMCGQAVADVYVVTAPDKSVASLSALDDAVVPAGYEKTVLKNKSIADLPFSMGEEKMYDFNNGAFKLNAKKVQDKNKAENDAILDAEKYNNNKVSAINKLKGLGLTDDELKTILN